MTCLPLADKTKIILHHYENQDSLVRQFKAGGKILSQTIKT